MIYTLFLLLQAPRYRGRTHPENAGVLICRMSQKQRNESYSLCSHGPPFTDISCGFCLTLSLTHSIEKNKKKAGFIGGGAEKRRIRERGRKAKLNPAALYSTSFGRSPRFCKTRRLLCLRIFIYLFVCLKRKTLVRREMSPNLSVLGGKARFQ